MAAPTIFDDVDKFSPEESPEEYIEGALGILEKDDEKLDCNEEGKVCAKPPIPAADPCICGPPWERYEDPNDDPPVMYVGMGACIGWFIGGIPENLSKGLFKRSLMAANFLFFLLFVDIFLFLVWIPSFFMVSGRLT